jgi:hypothetical protein
MHSLFQRNSEDLPTLPALSKGDSSPKQRACAPGLHRHIGLASAIRRGGRLILPWLLSFTLPGTAHRGLGSVPLPPARRRRTTPGGIVLPDSAGRSPFRESISAQSSCCRL